MGQEGDVRSTALVPGEGGQEPTLSLLDAGGLDKNKVKGIKNDPEEVVVVGDPDPHKRLDF